MLFNGASHADTAKPGDWGSSGCDASLPIRVIVARGTEESATSSSISPVADGIAAAFPGQVQVSMLDYAASWDAGSEADGVNRLVAMLNGQAGQCPATRTVLLGYSQGAMVVGDALSEAAARYNEDNGYTLSDAARKQVAAVELFGDPRFDASASYDAGDYDHARDGILEARDSAALGWVASRTVSYCNADDFACQVGGEGAPHAAYATNGAFPKAVAFAVDALKRD
ncbi:MAG: cutinase family protein [Bifidobacterium sp.]|nr:cutinase family protein [Bifidobacterium sp.]